MDIHAQTAAGIFGVPVDQLTPEQRRAGRTVNFGVVYGTDGKLALDFETDFREDPRSSASRLRGEASIRRFFDEYRGATLEDIRPSGNQITGRGFPAGQIADYGFRSGMSSKSNFAAMQAVYQYLAELSYPRPEPHISSTVLVAALRGFDV